MTDVRQVPKFGPIFQRFNQRSLTQFFISRRKYILSRAITLEKHCAALVFQIGLLSFSFSSPITVFTF